MYRDTQALGRVRVMCTRIRGCVSKEYVINEEGVGCKAVVVCQCRVEWLSRWLLMAHWRCTKAFDLSASLPCALAACPPSLFSSRFLAPLSPFLSPFSLPLSLSFSLDLASSRPSARVLQRALQFVRSSLFLSFSPSNEYTRTYTCKRSPPSVVSTLSSSTPVSFPRPLRPTPPALLLP